MTAPIYRGPPPSQVRGIDFPTQLRAAAARAAAAEAAAAAEPEPPSGSGGAASAPPAAPAAAAALAADLGLLGLAAYVASLPSGAQALYDRYAAQRPAPTRRVPWPAPRVRQLTSRDLAPSLPLPPHTHGRPLASTCRCSPGRRGALDALVAAGRHLLSAGGGGLAAFTVAAVTGAGLYRPGTDGTTAAAAATAAGEAGPDLGGCYVRASGTEAAAGAAAAERGRAAAAGDEGGGGGGEAGSGEGGGGGGTASPGWVRSPAHALWVAVLRALGALVRGAGERVPLRREVRRGREEGRRGAEARARAPFTAASCQSQPCSSLPGPVSAVVRASPGRTVISNFLVSHHGRP